MKIEHVCINVIDIEKMKAFYVKYFGFAANEKYRNNNTGWESYFLASEDGGTRLEIMSHNEIQQQIADKKKSCIIHIAISLGSKEKVDELTNRLRKDGYTIAGEPRTTGDGYYESVILDPEGNLLELTI